MNKNTAKHLIGDLVTYLVLVAAVVVTLLPLGWIISTSLKAPTEIFAKPPYWIPKQLSLESYRDVLFTSGIPGALLNSLIVGLTTALLSLFLGGSAGYAFARFRFRGKGFFSIFMLLSQMLPLTVLMIPLFYMENALGLVDTKLGLAVAHLVISMPLVTWMAKGYFKGIPKEIEEAAIVDGCGTLQSLWFVVIPLLRPALAATGVYAFISSWNEFALANVLTRSERSRTVPIALGEFSSFFKVDWGDTMAAALLITVPIIILFLLIQKQFVEGLASGAVKG